MDLLLVTIASTSRSKIPLPSLSHTTSLSIVTFNQCKFLPAAISSCTNDEYCRFVGPTNDSLRRATRTSIIDGTRCALWLIADLEVDGREGVDIREHAREKRDLP